MSRKFTLFAGSLLALTGYLYVTAADPPIPDRRAQAKTLYDQGNWREAYDIYSALVLNSENAGEPLVTDFQHAVACLQQLQQQSQIDAFRQQAVELHGDDWYLLHAAGQSFIDGEHYGYIVAGDYLRGDQRGGGEYASSNERDRTQALQLYERAAALIPAADDEPSRKASFYRSLAQAVLFLRDGGNAWELQDLTDLTSLPDYEEGYYWWHGEGGNGKGAPVDADGKPVYYSRPESWETARNDGERWRWALEQMAVVYPAVRDEVDWTFANFQQQQFGVQTMRQWGISLPAFEDGADGDQDEAGPFAMHTLTDDETIARLANGVKRFTIPEEFNPVAIYKKLAAKEGNYAEASLGQLATIYADRQQYPKAAEQWRASIQRFGDPGGGKQQQLDQIVGNWGVFETVQAQAAGTGAKVDFRFRNASQVRFTAHAIKFEQLLLDVKAYLKSNPGQLDWQRMQIDNIGYMLVEQNQSKYLGEKVAEWQLDLAPRPNHFDRRITVTTPLQKAGAYLVVAKLADGNTSRIIVWLNDTAIVKKQLNGQSYYFVADALTGQPIAKAHVEFFGWMQEQIANRPGQYRVVTKNRAEFTSADGSIVMDPKSQDASYQWLIIARNGEGRFAHLGFSGVWYGEYYDQQYNETKTYVVTDRPVYRPEQTVEFKFWMRETKYDLADASRFANRQFIVRIHDPQGTEVFQQTIATDEFGGLSGRYELPAEAMLGQYSIGIDHDGEVGGGSNFRVEEYKKPEFEVVVEAPTKPVMLGETVTATIRARYYFGAPVTNATVKFKVERTPHEARWYPAMRWDWLYGEGYWWFSPDYTWYPGFARWGCFAPRPSWFPWNPDPPELVLDQEVTIGDDGTVQVEIDTALAKALHADEDHRYSITAEVVDASRRTIVGTGAVLVAREPFRVFAWTDRGHYQVGDTITASFQARTLDGNGVTGTGTLKLLKVAYDEQGLPVETAVQEWNLNPNGEGYATQEIKASEPGQYRAAYTLTDAEGHTIEGGYLFVIRGEGFDGSEFQFNDLELITEKTEYAPGETVNLLINTNRAGSAVLLFVRPSNGVYAGPPQLIRLDGKSTQVEVTVVQKDMPNFFVEAVTVANGKVHTVVREVIVPPEQRVLNVEVVSNSDKYLPGAKAEVKVKLTEANGEPYVGSVVLSVYDRAVEYISGGSNVPEIREFFWKWRRSHHPSSEHNLDQWFWNLVKSGEISMSNLGAFGDLVAEMDEEMAQSATKFLAEERSDRRAGNRAMLRGYAAPMAAGGLGGGGAMVPGAPAMDMAEGLAMDAAAMGDVAGEPAPPLVEAAVRTNFADTAYWNAALTCDADGVASVSFDMPENLSDWKFRAWGMGHGTRVGEGTITVPTAKNLIVRLQAPRFFVEKDEVVLSAIVHNYLAADKEAQVGISVAGNVLAQIVRTANPQTVLVPAGGETRVEWRFKVMAEGTAKVTAKALTDEESDAMEQSFPVYVHGFLKTESFSGVVRAEADSGVIEFTVPADRRPEQSRLEVRYSPTLAGAMVDALPYLVEYPYGCTEQTLNRFLPTVITQNILQRMNVDLAAIQAKRTNLNAQEIGDDAARAAQWKHWDRNPVFDEAEVARMVKQGVEDLTAMQLSDGGWGWFSGWGEHSYPHTTAVVVHGLQIARQNDVALVDGVLENGIAWLTRYQAEQVKLLQEGERRATLEGDALANHRLPYRTQADDLDALVYMVLVDADVADAEMQRFLYRDRLEIALYSQALFGLALHKQQQIEQRDMIIRNIDQFLKVDDENQTAYIDLPNNNSWWYWHGSNIEANAFYLKLLTAVNPQDPKASGLVKYLLNNRKHATYWESTRDTAYCIEALADYLTASGEAEPNVLVEVWLDGELQQSVEITPEVLFSFDNSFVVEGANLTDGPHRLEIRKRPLDPNVASASPVYFNAYLTNFSTEDFITAAGLEIKVGRKFYKLVQREGASDAVQGSNGQVVDQKVLKYDRVEIASLEVVESGDLIEIELEIDSKNDYEYVLFEDFKAAGCEPVDLQSGYTAGGLGAYVEFRDEKVAFFLRTLARGKHSVSYRVRAEVPGLFSALPTHAYAMYAPELQANSDEMKLGITDRRE